MSWYNTVVLSFSAGEFDGEEPPKNFGPLKKINAWLKRRHYEPMENLSRGTLGSNALLFGGCFNRLKVDEFLECVKGQGWNCPNDVQLLFWSDNASKFSMIMDGWARYFAASTTSRLRVMREGHNIIRSARIPKPFVLVDTREKEPLPLFVNHKNWIGGERRVALKNGDYTIEGMEKLISLERKSLSDLVACTVTYRDRFLASCERLSRLRWKAILIEATLEDIKAGFEQFHIPSKVHPNAVCGTLDAIEAKFGIPVIYTSTDRDLATERAASWLSKHFAYWWLEKEGHGRVLIDSDRL